MTESLGYNPYMDGQALFKDAIRVYWRLATDYMWNQVRGAGWLIGWVYLWVMYLSHTCDVLWVVLD